MLTAKTLAPGLGHGPSKPAGATAATVVAPPAAPLRMAYLVSRYPAVSHTFILREVCQLRALGLDISVASINPPDRAVAAMNADEQAEMAATYYVKQHGWRGGLVALVAGLAQPRAWLRGLFYALRLGGWNLPRTFFALFYFTEALMLQRWMRARGLTHLHVHFATAAANVALVLKAMQPIRLSLTVHGPDEFYDVPGQWLREKILAADLVVCISRYARSQLMQLVPASHWSKLEVCPLGVDPSVHAPAAQGAGAGPFTVLCVGRLTPVKGQRVLVEACRQLVQAGRELRLVLVGTGPDAEDLQRAVEQDGLQAHTELTGALNQEQVLARYARADAFVLPSFAEGVPVVLMEAMACGVPCVTTRITGIPELIRDGQDGLLVTPSDTSELAGALARLMDSPDLRAQLSANGRARVQSQYNLAANVLSLSHIFKSNSEVRTC